MGVVGTVSNSMRGRTFRFKSPAVEAMVPGTRVAPAFQGSCVSRNRRGSSARVTPDVRARVGARTLGPRHRAVACASESLAREAPIPEMFCGSPRLFPRAREWHRAWHSERWRSLGNNFNRNSALPNPRTRVHFILKHPFSAVGSNRSRMNEPNRTRDSSGSAETKNRCALGERCGCSGVGTAEQKQAPRDARRGYRRRRLAFSLV